MSNQEDDDDVNTDRVLEEMGGCGRFQVTLAILIYINSIPSLWSFQNLAYALYNPGWTCKDNETVMNGADWMTGSPFNRSSTFNETSYVQDDDEESCRVFEACTEVEFSPEASTVVTEWGLMCGRASNLNIILQANMAGALCSTVMIGYVGDRLGRKMPYLISLVVHAVLDLISVFSNSWEMFATLTFLIGFNTLFERLAHVLFLEYCTSKWRLRGNSDPTWGLVGIMFAVAAMVTRDWKVLKLITIVSGLVTCVPLFWMPKSLRWLSAKGKEDEAVCVANKIAKFNKSPVANRICIESLIKKQISKPKKKSSYSMLHLFKRGYIVTSLVVAVWSAYIDVIYFGISFGVAALPGNIYVNMMTLAVSDLIGGLLSYCVAGKFNRKTSIFVCFLTMTVCQFGVVALDLNAAGDVKQIGILVLAMIIKVFVNLTWFVMITVNAEMYPTVVRSNVTMYSYLMSCLGGVLSPYVIPMTPETFYVCYLAMGLSSLLCTPLVFLIRETKGKPLRDNFDDDNVCDVISSPRVAC